ncbi:MAG: cytochrome b [Rhodoferax sp.]
MTPLNTPKRFSTPSIAMHWLMVLLLVAVAASMELRGMFPKGDPMREAFKTWHYMLGISVFALVWLRLLLRWAGPTPLIQPAPPAWQNAMAKLMHLGLYALMLGLPLAGWLILSAKGKPVPFFFGLELPPLIAENKSAAEWIKELHEAGATIGYVLVGLHAAAGLYHHYIQRDNTLQRMLPGKA